MSKTPTDYYEVTTGDGTPFVVLEFREGRFPIQKTLVTAAGVIELYAADGSIETLGSLNHPCSANLLKRIRTHHEGLLLVQTDPAREDGTSEQLLSARFLLT